MRRQRLAVYGGLFSLYVTIILYSSYVCWRDPTSLYFRPSLAYQARYSKIREREADDFIQSLSSQVRRNASTYPNLCIGVPTVMRSGRQYFDLTIGSLFDNLSASDRQETFFCPFIAQSNYGQHFAYGQSWLWSLADDVLVYDNLSVQARDRIIELEDRKDFWQKSLLDYTTILEKCYVTGASYIAILEDDVVALKSWYGNAQRALQQISKKGPFLYLRLFYSEEFLGRQAEDAPIYALFNVIGVLIVTILSFTARSRSRVMREMFGRRLTFVMSISDYTVMTTLFFAAGTSIIPLDPHNRGFVEMNNGCCSQGLIFPRVVVPTLTEWFREKKDGHADLRIEQFAIQSKLKRWALVPSVLQHIGKETSHEKDLPEEIKYNMSLAERVWNFGFENIDGL